MHRSVIKNKNGRLFNVLAKVVNRRNQKSGIDILLCLIGYCHIVGAKDAEQIQFFIPLRENPDLLASCLPRSRQNGLHRETGFIAKVAVDLSAERQLRQHF